MKKTDCNLYKRLTPSPLGCRPPRGPGPGRLRPSAHSWGGGVSQVTISFLLLNLALLLRLHLCFSFPHYSCSSKASFVSFSLHTVPIVAERGSGGASCSPPSSPSWWASSQSWWSGLWHRFAVGRWGGGEERRGGEGGAGSGGWKREQVEVEDGRRNRMRMRGRGVGRWGECGW